MAARDVSALRDLEEQNRRLKALVADLTLENITRRRGSASPDRDPHCVELRPRELEHDRLGAVVRREARNQSLSQVVRFCDVRLGIRWRSGGNDRATSSPSHPRSERVPAEVASIRRTARLRLVGSGGDVRSPDPTNDRQVALARSAAAPPFAIWRPLLIPATGPRRALARPRHPTAAGR